MDLFTLHPFRACILPDNNLYYSDNPGPGLQVGIGTIIDNGRGGGHVKKVSNIRTLDVGYQSKMQEERTRTTDVCCDFPLHRETHSQYPNKQEIRMKANGYYETRSHDNGGGNS